MENCDNNKKDRQLDTINPQMLENMENKQERRKEQLDNLENN